MTITNESITRSACPSWCERTHAAGDVEPEGHRGLRWSPEVADDGYWVEIPTVLNEDGDVVVWAKALDS